MSATKTQGPIRATVLSKFGIFSATVMCYGKCSYNTGTCVSPLLIVEQIEQYLHPESMVTHISNEWVMHSVLQRIIQYRGHNKTTG